MEGEEKGEENLLGELKWQNGKNRKNRTNRQADNVGKVLP